MMNTKEPYQIFISYRRYGSDAHARILYDKLRDRGYSVFLDFESLFSGGFRENIITAIKECNDFILLIPNGGLERCADANDLFRAEIRTAIESKKNIIPVFVGGFKMPARESIPTDIIAIADQNGIECSMEYFDAVFEKICKNILSVPRDLLLIQTMQRLKKRMFNLDHAYFKKWAYMKLNTFMSNNESFFDGTNWTNPHSEDTFGISGIAFTQKSIKAISVVQDYWEDNFTIEYLKRQGELITRGVDIWRVFVIEKDKFEDAKAKMERQRELGIKVYYIFKGNEYIDPQWLEEDYLIQDDKLLVQIYCSTHQFSSQNKSEEQITVDIVTVKNKIERFQRILERAEPFVESTK